MAPRLIGPVPDSRNFAQAADLPPGHGATIVVRLEVLGSGELGRIELDVSSGYAAIDQAALAYARTLTWVGGTKDGVPVAMWVRWAVRLEATSGSAGLIG
jgi:TonB family protein